MLLPLAKLYPFSWLPIGYLVFGSLSYWLSYLLCVSDWVLRSDRYPSSTPSFLFFLWFCPLTIVSITPWRKLYAHFAIFLLILPPLLSVLFPCLSFLFVVVSRCSRVFQAKFHPWITLPDLPSYRHAPGVGTVSAMATVWGRYPTLLSRLLSIYSKRDAAILHNLAAFRACVIPLETRKIAGVGNLPSVATADEEFRSTKRAEVVRHGTPMSYSMGEE